MEAPTLEDPAVVKDFLRRVPACEEALSRYQQDGNRLLLEELDGLLDRAAARAL